MNKKDLAIAIVEKTDNELSLAAASRVIDAAMEAMVEALAKGEKVSIPKFAVLRVKGRKASHGVNPRTKERISIPACKVVVFRPADALKAAINS